MKKILVYRFSAMGDVVMVLPVLKGLLESDDQLEIYLLTRPFLFPVFEGIDRLHLVAADLKGKHKGVPGLFRLFRQLRREINPDQVFDLHQVMRTKVLNFFFRLSKTPVVCFNKGRDEKKAAVKAKMHEQLPSSIDRYAAAFSSAGFRFVLPAPGLFASSPKAGLLKKLGIDRENGEKLVGIAPFARHRQKVWGVDKVRELMSLLQQVPGLSVLLFGGGAGELKTLEQLAAEFPNAVVANTKIDFREELQLLPHLDVMVSMDSANMHLGAMSGIPVVSVWGATHPSLGFAPYHQPAENLMQYNGHELDCRPCSVFGNKKCRYGDVRCMQYIPVSQVAERIGYLLDHPIHHHLPLQH